jgi:hypothetical protein
MQQTNVSLRVVSHAAAKDTQIEAPATHAVHAGRPKIERA